MPHLTGCMRVQDTPPPAIAPYRRRTASRPGSACGHCRVDRPDGPDRVRLARRLVFAIALHACEAERETAGVLGALLQVIERNLDDELGPHVYGVGVTADLELQQLRRLPLEHGIGH